MILASLDPEKGEHYLIEAYQRLQTDKKLVIAGGDSHAEEYMKRIYSYAEENKNIILTDFVQGRVLDELFSNAYVFVVPSDVEGMAMSLLEAMSYGNCCLVSDIPENLEVVEDNAFSFQKGDVGDLCVKLRYLLEHKDEVRKYKKMSSQFICGKYNWEEVVDETVRVYGKARRKRNGKS